MSFFTGRRFLRNTIILTSLFVLLSLSGVADAASAQPGGYIGSDNERAGFGVTTDITNFNIAQLRGGWYLKWGAYVPILQPSGYTYMPMLRVTGKTFTPNGSYLASVIAAKPGATWIIGNEADNRYQDNVLPQDYAVAYHDAYQFIKQRDPSAQIAINGVTQATPLRLQWLDLVWQAYRTRYGQDMPVDVWNLHTFVLREQEGSWGAAVPPGVNAKQGMLWNIEDHDRIDLIRDQIIRFRQWMKARGQQNKPLINTEYGILMPVDYGFDYERVSRFLRDSFNLFNTLSDPNLGYAADNNRLVQRWCWFALDSQQFEGQYINSLFDKSTHQITPLGQAFSSWTQQHYTPYVDLLFTGNPQVKINWSIFDNQPDLLTVSTNIVNNGNQTSGKFAVQLTGNSAGSPVLGEAIVNNGVGSRYSSPVSTSIIASVPIAAPKRFYTKLDGRNEVSEFDEANNTGSFLVSPSNTLDIRLSNFRTTLSSIPLIRAGQTVSIPLAVTLSNLGSVGVVGNLDVEFWNGRPDSGGTRISQTTLSPETTTMVTTTLTTTWGSVPPGFYTVFAKTSPANDVNITNNSAALQLFIPATRTFLPLIRGRR